ncbi:uncharacterized protein BXZ73DRAFT_76935 [Epithele typhae]|uniref:uncharacterized protein n=1 Tax=Epithele typhae TaxID=378194 RepID=UPI002007E18F|nr:uncharacterized protein BXZ73DRAFT_76935 [Epithele typhae]KAH9934444.1 hypothetical protein BXZ73DRAFT_76935 [Epithele typhae]
MDKHGNAHEATPLIGQRTEPRTGEGQVVPMKYSYLRRTTGTRVRAFEGDLALQYIYSADTHPFSETRRRLRNIIVWAGAIFQSRMFTVDGGDAVIYYAPPKPLRLVKLVVDVLARFMSPEARKRRKEVDSALEEIIKREFGDRVEDMYEVKGLAVTPEKQGRGYATALMRTVLDKSDTEGKDSWVVTGRSHTFYATLGYTIVGTGQTGGENPTWSHGPVDWIVTREQRALSVMCACPPAKRSAL